MNCPGIDPANPFLWIFTAGFFLGAAASRLTVVPSRARNPIRAARLRWPLFLIYMSVAILLGSAGLIFSGAERFLSWKSLYLFLGVTGVSAAGNRFKRSVGTPLVFLALGWFVYLQLVLTGWSCYSVIEEAARLRILERGGESIVVSLDSGDTPDIIEAAAPILEIDVIILEIDSPYILHGGKFYYRLLDADGDEDSIPDGGGRHAEGLASVMPGMRYLRHSTPIDERMELFQVYRIVLDRTEVIVEPIY